LGRLRNVGEFFESNRALRANADQLRRAVIGEDVTFDESVGLVTLDWVLPPTRVHVLNGTGDEFPVFEGDVMLRMPITHNQRSVEKGDDGTRGARISGTARWQSCDDEVCHLPGSHRFELEIPARGSNIPKFRRAQGLTRMDTAAHFRRMTERRVSAER
jgi:hypothetical protein